MEDVKYIQEEINVNIENYKVTELKEYLKKYKLQLTGKKVELYNRIKKFQK
jgi:hypothetical protein